MRCFFLIIILCFSAPLFAQTIVTLPLLASEFCQGSALVVPFTVSGAFSTNNVFTAQISNADGDFSSPTGIGYMYGFNPDTINAVIPIDVAAGNNYRIRVVSSAPFVAGIDNGIDLSVFALPQVTLQTIDTICLEDLPFELAGGNPLGGFYFGEGVSFDTFYPIMVGIGSSQITYNFTDANGCEAFAVDSIEVMDCATFVNNEFHNLSISIYPNPVRGYINIQSTEKQNLTISLLSFLGDVLMSENHENCSFITMHVSDYAPGNYLLVIASSQKRQVIKMQLY
jgi:hypothetical protein